MFSCIGASCWARSTRCTTRRGGGRASGPSFSTTSSPRLRLSRGWLPSTGSCAACRGSQLARPWGASGFAVFPPTRTNCRTNGRKWSSGCDSHRTTCTITTTCGTITSVRRRSCWTYCSGLTKMLSVRRQTGFGLSAYTHKLSHERPEMVFWLRFPSHYMHHYHNMWHHNFGTTTLLWDRLFGTYKDVEWKPANRFRFVNFFRIHWFGANPMNDFRKHNLAGQSEEPVPTP